MLQPMGLLLLLGLQGVSCLLGFQKLAVVGLGDGERVLAHTQGVPTSLGGQRCWGGMV